MIVFRKPFVKVGQLWFDDGKGETNPPCAVDAIEYIQRRVPVDGGTSSDFLTLTIDLSADPERIFAGFKKDTRNEVRRASEKDRLSHEKWEVADEATLDRFIRFYREFARQKSRGEVSRDILKKYGSLGLLKLSVVRTPSGEPLTWHSYFMDQGTARLLHSASHYRAAADSAARSLVGRANRLHHWLDIQWFRSAGCLHYDLGGWTSGGETPEQSRISRFKEEFGGAPAKYYNGIRPVTARGAFYLWLKRRLSRH